MQTRLGLTLGVFALVFFGYMLADAPPGSCKSGVPTHSRTLRYSMNEEQAPAPAPESAVEEAAVPAQEEAV